MVRPLVSGVSKVAEVLDTPPLDPDEKEGGVQAFSALLYQYGGELDARVLVGLWIAGVTLPRVLHTMKKQKEEKKMVTAVATNAHQRPEYPAETTPVRLISDMPAPV